MFLVSGEVHIHVFCLISECQKLLLRVQKYGCWSFQRDYFSASPVACQYFRPLVRGGESITRVSCAKVDSRHKESLAF